MVTPTFADYVALLCNLFERFWHHAGTHRRRGHPYVYAHKVLLMFFVVMHQPRLFRFKAQRRWFEQHPDIPEVFGFDAIPHRTTLSRR